MRIVLIPALLLAAAPACADVVTGTVQSYDPNANRVIFEDKSVWMLGDASAPADLTAGDRITVVYAGAGYDGVSAIDLVRRAEP